MQNAVLSEHDRQALLEALDDEHKAWAIYDQVMTDLGDVRPFSRIRESEARHIGALTTFARRHGVEVPSNPWVGRAPRFASVREACEAGIQAEVENEALYARLLAETSDSELRSIFTALQRASQERHLPASRRCASRGAGGAGGGGLGRGAGRGPGRGAGRGRGRGQGGGGGCA
jgi:rubrerythrin